jgi:hypothetical protein
LVCTRNACRKSQSGGLPSTHPYLPPQRNDLLSQPPNGRGQRRGASKSIEGGEPKGIDFQFECDSRLQTSSGYETFPAKWKKPGQELVILQQQFGKTNYDTCRLKVLVKDFVYVSHNGNLTTELVDIFKQWMAKHDYDPEHGKNTPIRTTPENMPAGTNPAPSSGSTASPQPGAPQQ